MQDNQAEQELVRLQAQLEEAVAAEHFFETASGRIILDIINKRVNLSVKKITGDGFEKDHTGYVNELMWLRANQKLIRELHVAASPIYRSKLQERIDTKTEVIRDGRK